MYAAYAFACFFVIIYLIFLIGGTVYMIQWHGWSCWWMVLTVIFAGTVSLKSPWNKDKE